MQSNLLPLLDYLAASRPQEPIAWEGWEIRRVSGGFNNILLRATSSDDDIAIKFTRRDERQRARREYESLALLAERAPTLAPRPLLHIAERYSYPVVVQEWLTGTVQERPPDSPTAWAGCLDHFAAIHQIRADGVASRLRPAVAAIASAKAAVARIHHAYGRIADDATRATLQPLLRQAQQLASAAWPANIPVLCRCDPNTLNFIRRPGAWASVDWENSGWGDPAFEIGDLMAHPAYSGVTQDTWRWVVSQYCQRMEQEGWEEQIWLYYRLTVVWWAVTFARFARELAEGKQPQTLADRSQEWAAGVPQRAASYFERACSLVGDWKRGSQG